MPSTKRHVPPARLQRCVTTPLKTARRLSSSRTMPPTWQEARTMTEPQSRRTRSAIRLPSRAGGRRSRASCRLQPARACHMRIIGRYRASWLSRTVSPDMPGWPRGRALLLLASGITGRVAVAPRHTLNSHFAAQDQRSSGKADRASRRTRARRRKNGSWQPSRYAHRYGTKSSSSSP